MNADQKQADTKALVTRTAVVTFTVVTVVVLVLLLVLGALFWFFAASP